MKRTDAVRTAIHALNVVLHWRHLELVRTWELPADRFSEFIPLDQTQHEARRAGMSLEDYIEHKYRAQGATQDTLDGMEELGVFARRVERVCEIGPGSGRYLQRVLQRCHPESYEIYETALDWRLWLAETFDVIAHPADGRSLALTGDDSVDLVHAHKVFPGLGVLGICRYLDEMARVTRSGGHIVCDALTEECLSEEKLARWLASGIAYPGSMMPRDFAARFMSRRGCEFRGSFHVAMRPGTTETLVFRKH